MVPSESLLAVPLSVTVVPEVTVWLTPALAKGRTFARGLTVILTVDAALAAPRLSVTISENVSVVALGTVGPGNVGCEAEALLSVTAVPAV